MINTIGTKINNLNQFVQNTGSALGKMGQIMQNNTKNFLPFECVDYSRSIRYGSKNSFKSYVNMNGKNLPFSPVTSVKEGITSYLNPKTRYLVEATVGQKLHTVGGNMNKIGQNLAQKEAVSPARVQQSLKNAQETLETASDTVKENSFGIAVAAATAVISTVVLANAQENSEEIQKNAANHKVDSMNPPKWAVTPKKTQEPSACLTIDQNEPVPAKVTPIVDFIKENPEATKTIFATGAIVGAVLGGVFTIGLSALLGRK